MKNAIIYDELQRRVRLLQRQLESMQRSAGVKTVGEFQELAYEQGQLAALLDVQLWILKTYGKL